MNSSNDFGYEFLLTLPFYLLLLLLLVVDVAYCAYMQPISSSLLSFPHIIDLLIEYIGIRYLNNHLGHNGYGIITFFLSIEASFLVVTVSFSLTSPLLLYSHTVGLQVLRATRNTAYLELAESL